MLGKLPDFDCMTKMDTVPEAVAQEGEDREAFRLTREERKRKK